jgi:hypothetical protein
VRNTRADMSGAWGQISQRFRHPPTPPQLQSPVADLPYDQAVEVTASMVEQWKVEQPSLPHLEVPRSTYSSLCWADRLAARSLEAKNEALVSRLHWRRPGTHAHSSYVDEHTRRYSHEPIRSTRSTIRAALAVTLGILFWVARSGYT